MYLCLQLFVHNNHPYKNEFGIHGKVAEWSKALRSGRSPLLWAWVRIPLLTRILFVGLVVTTNFLWTCTGSRVAQWKRAGPITQRSVDRNYALLNFLVW